MNFETLLLETINHTLVITINRPDKLNALSEKVFAELKFLLVQIPQLENIHGVILTGAGEKSFIAGADIKAMSAMTPEQGEQFAGRAQAVTEMFEALSVPVIACVNGYALGGGCEMAMSCDFIFATENATFGQPEVNLGLIPGFGGCVRLSRYVGSGMAKQMIYTGEQISAARAQRLGLVNELFATKSEMISAAIKMIEQIATKSPFAVAICKKVITQSVGLNTHEALAVERIGFRAVFEHPEKSVGVSAFLEKRRPDFKIDTNSAF